MVFSEATSRPCRSLVPPRLQQWGTPIGENDIETAKHDHHGEKNPSSENALCTFMISRVEDRDPQENQRSSDRQKGCKNQNKDYPSSVCRYIHLRLQLFPSIRNSGRLLKGPIVSTAIRAHDHVPIKCSTAMCACPLVLLTWHHHELSIPNRPSFLRSFPRRGSSPITSSWPDSHSRAHCHSVRHPY